MKSFAIKMAVFAIIVVGLVVLVQKVSDSMNEPKPKAKKSFWRSILGLD